MIDAPMNHLGQDRLRDVAERDVLVFTEREIGHLQDCGECFRAWAKFIYLATGDREAGFASAIIIRAKYQRVRFRPLCEEKSKLISEFQKTTNLYASCVLEMTRAVGHIHHAEFELLKRLVDRAYEACGQARTALYEHTIQHDC